MRQENTKNNFTRIIIVILCAMLAGMILFRYFRVDPIGEITTGLLVLIAFLVVVSLSESFDNFSIGKVVSISRKIKEREVEIERLEQKNSFLLSQVVSVKVSQSQSHSSTTVQGDYYATFPKVETATEEEIEAKKNNETSLQREEPAPRVPLSKIKNAGLEKFLKSRNFPQGAILSDVKFSSFLGIDPISSTQLIFDRYLKTDDEEIFIEVRPERSILMFRDRLYVMLSKILHYRSTRKVDAHLEVVFVKIKSSETRSSINYVERLIRDFQPAIESGILIPRYIELAENEVDLE